MEKTKIQNFTKGNIPKQLITFSLPLFLSNLLQVVYNMVDMIVVGNTLGDVGISAVSVGGDVSMLLTFVAMGFSSAAQVIIAKYIGAGKSDKIGKFVGTMSGFLLIGSLVISVAGILTQDLLLGLMNTPTAAYKGAGDYSFVCMIGLVFIYGYNAVSAILRGMGDSKTPFVFISIAAVLNLILDLVFVVGFDFGAGGAAVATVISQAASFILCVLYLFKKRREFKLNMKLRDFIFWEKPLLLDLVKLGAPMAIKMAAIQVSKLFVNSFVNSYGVAVSAFAGVANKIASVSNLISNAMNAAGSTMVGQNLGAREYTRVKKILASLAVITVSISTLMSVFFVIFPTEIFSVFIKDASKEVLDIAIGFIPIAILLFYGSALRAIMNALINGSGNTGINFVTAILDGIVMRIGLALLFGLALDMRHYGFWLGDALAGFTPFLIGIVFYFTGLWKKERKETD